MISVQLDSAGKKFGREWIFRNVDRQLQPGDRLVITGSNGSGKSTLLQVIAGFMNPSEGRVLWHKGNGAVDTTEMFRLVSFASPYLQLIEELTLEEHIAHSARFKPFAHNIPPAEIANAMGLAHARSKFIRQFSSGMKQRVRLALALLADTPLLLLDEPTSNLDSAGVDWYRQMVEQLPADRTVVVASNMQEQEYFFCTSSLRMEDVKPR